MSAGGGGNSRRSSCDHASRTARGGEAVIGLLVDRRDLLVPVTLNIFFHHNRGSIGPPPHGR
jgi:hypothetical protein